MLILPIIFAHHFPSTKVLPMTVISTAIPRQWLEARGERFPVESGDIAKLLVRFGVGNLVVRWKEEVVTSCLKVHYRKTFVLIGGSWRRLCFFLPKKNLPRLEYDDLLIFPVNLGALDWSNLIVPGNSWKQVVQYWLNMFFFLTYQKWLIFQAFQGRSFTSCTSWFCSVNNSNESRRFNHTLAGQTLLIPNFREANFSQHLETFANDLGREKDLGETRMDFNMMAKRRFCSIGIRREDMM